MKIKMLSGKHKWLHRLVFLAVFGILTLLLYLLAFRLLPYLWPEMKQDVPHFAIPYDLIIVSLAIAVLFSSIAAFLLLKRIRQNKS